MIIYNASTDGSVEMPKSFKVTRKGKVYIWINNKWTLAILAMDYKMAFIDLIREQYGIEVR